MTDNENADIRQEAQVDPAVTADALATQSAEYAQQSAMVARYVELGSPVLCPRCSNGLPVCSEPGWTHDTACALYNWSEDLEVCLRCELEMAPEDFEALQVDEHAPRIVDIELPAAVSVDLQEQK